jgi:hypothetical protein
MKRSNKIAHFKTKAGAAAYAAAVQATYPQYRFEPEPAFKAMGLFGGFVVSLKYRHKLCPDGWTHGAFVLKVPRNLIASLGYTGV